MLFQIEYNSPYLTIEKILNTYMRNEMAYHGIKVAVGATPCFYFVFSPERRGQFLARFAEIHELHGGTEHLVEGNKIFTSGVDIIVESSNQIPWNKVAFFSEDCIGLQSDVVERDFHPWIRTRILTETLVNEFLEYKHFVSIYHVDKVEGKIPSIDKEFLWGVCATGCRWRLVPEPMYSPYSMSVAVYEPDYYKYLFAVMDFETAVRFAGDHAQEKIYENIETQSRKITNPLF